MNPSPITSGHTEIPTSLPSAANESATTVTQAASPCPAAPISNPKIDRAIHAGIQASKSLNLSSEMSLHDIHSQIGKLTESIAHTQEGLKQLRAPCQSPADSQKKIAKASQHVQETMSHIQGILYNSVPGTYSRQQTRDSVAHTAGTILHSTCASTHAPALSTAAAAHGTVSTHSAAHHSEAAERMEESVELLLGSAALVAAGLASTVKLGAEVVGSEGVTDHLEISGDAIGCIEILASGKSLVCDGIKLHKIRTELKGMRAELKTLLAPQNNVESDKPASAGDRLEQFKESIGSFFKKSSKPEPAAASPLSINPRISILETKIAEGELKLAKAGVGVAISSVMTGATMARSSLEITSVVAKELFVNSLAIASSSLGLGMGLIGLGLSCKKLAEDIGSYRSTSQAVEQAKDPKEIAELEMKLTDSKVGIARGAITVASSSLAITSSALTITALATGAVLGTAIAATGFGALGLGVLAIGIGIGYLIYKNRAAIKHFFSNLMNAINNSSPGAGQIDHMAKALAEQMHKDLKASSNLCITHLDRALDEKILERDMNQKTSSKVDDFIKTVGELKKEIKKIGQESEPSQLAPALTPPELSFT